MKSNPEAEINRIRLELYEETKDLTIEEHTQRVNNLAAELAKEYGFRILPSAGAEKPGKNKTSGVL